MNTVDTENMEKSQIPEECSGLCWGGFFLTWIWGIFNKTYISFMLFIPIIGIVMPFIILFKGREWAWKNNDWRNAEHFNSTQKKWSFAGVISFIFILTLVVIALGIGVPHFQKFGTKSKTSEAKIVLATIYSAQSMYMVENGIFSYDFNEIGFIPNDYQKRYKYGYTETSEFFAKYCSDCYVTKDSFKVVAVGNIDQDETLDVWTINNKKELVHLINDVDE